MCRGSRACKGLEVGEPAEGMAEPAVFDAILKTLGVLRVRGIDYPSQVEAGALAFLFRVQDLDVSGDDLLAPLGEGDPHEAEVGAIGFLVVRCNHRRTFLSIRMLARP